MKPYYTPGSEGERKVKWVERVSYLLDEQFRFPGTNFRFGLDPILNLVPVLGDLSGFIISGALILTVAKKGAGSKLLVLMLINILLDAVIGGIPILGMIFDFYYKANTRNIRLLKEYYLEGRHQGSGRNILLLLIGVLVLCTALLIFGIWKLTEFIFRASSW